jgi:hypothetical protein
LLRRRNQSDKAEIARMRLATSPRPAVQIVRFFARWIACASLKG